MTQNAIIYARVSSIKQREDNSIASQLDACRKYAATRGLNVLREFIDDGCSGKDANRPDLQNMLQWVRTHPDTTVIAYDTSRIARHVGLMNNITDKLAAAKCSIAFVSMHFDNTPEGSYARNIISATDQYQREANARKVKLSMIGQAQNGIWLLNPPIGYIRSRDGNKRVILVRDEPTATIIADAISKYASGQLSTKQDVADFLTSRLRRPVTRDNARKIVENPIYTARFGYKPWNIEIQDWKIEPIINSELHRQVMNKIAGQGRAPQRSDLLQDFFLRRYVLCGYCGRELTSCWSKGKANKFPYYLCSHKNCSAYGKSIRRADIENAMFDIIASIRADDSILALVDIIVDDIADKMRQDAKIRAKELQTQISAIEKEIGGMMATMANCKTESVRDAYELKIQKLIEQKEELFVESQGLINPSNTPKYKQAFERTKEFFRTPFKLFKNGDYKQKRKVLECIFIDKPKYFRGEGFRTPETAGIFSLTADSASKKIEWCG